MNKAEKTRQFIIEKTAPIFNMKGYAGTSLSDMTEATGLTKGSIYGNFSSKDEVAMAAFDYNVKKVNKIINDEISKRSTAKDKLLVHVHVYENFLKFPFPEGGCPILNTAIEADDTHPPLKKKVAEVIINWKNKLEEIIKKGIDDKEFKTSIDPERVAVSIIALIEGGIMIAKVTGKMQYRASVMQSIAFLVESLQ
jgi:TetR/AcrR family transcriptional regulator, transcriptional repressor for nem operon